MLRLPLAVALAFTVATALAADSVSSPLRVGVTVTRRCAVSTGAGVDVQCTRGSVPAVRAVVGGRALAPAALLPSGPGAAGASIPIDAPRVRGRVVTILF